jgi:general secretion pathway protein D
MKVTGAIDGNELSMILHALSQQSNTDLLSAPKVVTKSGQEAIMKVVEEYIYPTEFTVTTLQAANNTGTSTATGAAVEPGGFEMREVGVILQVVPEVSAEGQMINLVMNPQVVSEPTWKDYGYDMPDPNGGAPIHLPMEQPFFKVRSISTSISIYNGATVVMGGMITEVRRANNDKIPFLGSIPYLGRFFQNKSERSEKRNLLIFVTARLVDPAGRAVKTSSEPSLAGDKPKPAIP